MTNYIISRVNTDCIGSVTGLDWSPVAVQRLQGNAVYSKVLLCQSSILPFNTNEFDVAISIENLEHLYVNEVVPAIAEMTRVAKHIIIVTPAIHNIINLGWLNVEIPAAETDDEEISEEEYQALEGAVHKSAVLAHSMANAGFEIGSPDHGRYYAKSESLNLNEITALGLSKTDIESTNQRYINLLHNSRDLYRALNENL
jgi:SAM-dependent methyltransferase